MIPACDLPASLPVFPLPGAMLLPRTRLPLHLFEPRYLAMLDDALKTRHRMIGMVQPQARGGGAEGLHRIGCAGRVTAFSETEDGRYMITLTGVSRFRVRDEVQGFTPYRRFEVSWTGFERDLDGPEKDTDHDRAAFFDLLHRFLIARDINADWSDLKKADDELLVNSLSMLCPFDTEEKQALLEAPSLSTRRETLVTLLEFSLRSGAGEENLQ